MLKVIKNIFIEEKYKDTIKTAAQYLKQEGIQLGRQESDYQCNRDNTKTMLAKGIDYLIVKENTGLSDAE